MITGLPQSSAHQRCLQPETCKECGYTEAGWRGRKVAIPTVLDRFIQQALLQVLLPQYDPRFSPYSYGFRPGKNAHQAIVQAQTYIREGYEWVVDIDLESFFDRVHHDRLIAVLSPDICDKRVLHLIRRFLTA